MTTPSRALVGALLATALTATANAAIVHVEVTGTVDYNFIGGALASVPPGSPVSMGFNVDSNVFVDSPNYPTRGYVIDLASFDMNVGGVHLQLDNPQPFADAYFVLRNDDPAVDGFFMSQGDVELPRPVNLHLPGVGPVHDLDFSRGFDTDTTLSSLDILDAVGTYGFENMSSYLWTIGRIGNPGAEYAYSTITISVVPEPATLTLFGLGAAALLLGVRKTRQI